MKRLLIALCLLALLTGCGTPQQPVADEAEAPAQAVEESEAPADELPPLEVEDVVSLLESDIKKVYDNYEIWVSDKKDSVLLYLWQDGLATGCLKAGKGISPYTTQWGEIVNSMKNLSISVQGMFDAAGRSDVAASVVIRNDLNPDAVLLMTRNGRVVLDAANG